MRRLRDESRGAPLGDLFRPAPETLRFRLGASLADLRIPFRLAPQIRSAWQAAATDAFVRLAQRHRAILAPGEAEDLEKSHGWGALEPACFAPSPLLEREAERRAALDAVELHAGLDAGVVSAVLGADHPLRRLADTLQVLFAKARDEAARSETGEATPWLVALMLRTVADQVHTALSDLPVSGPNARFLRGGAAALLAHMVSRVLRASGFEEDEGLDARTALLVRSALGVLPFLGARPLVAQTGISAHGVAFEFPPPRLEDAVARLRRGEDPDRMAREIALQLNRDAELRRRLERAAALQALREQSRVLSRLLETTRIPFTLLSDGPFALAVVRRDAFEGMVATDDGRRAAAAAAREAARVVPGEIRQRLEQLAQAFRDWRDDEPAAWMKPGEARLQAAQAVVAFAADTLLDRLSQGAAQLLLERTGAETEGGDAAEYDSGRLYLLSEGDKPILRARARQAMVAHLFADMKDFTRRTTYLKEVLIADYLQREFYAPILRAAALDPSGRQGGRPPVALNNLLGDAVSFSGDVVALFQLARRIKAILAESARRAEGDATQTVVTERVRELEGRFRVRRDSLERQLRELGFRAPRAPADRRAEMLESARQKRAELERLEAEHQAALSLAAGEKLEAGVFVAWGAAPVVMRFEDPSFGALRVAIAEKINESARGTGRSPRVREQVDALRALTRRESGREVELPFSVFVEQGEAGRGEIYNAGAAASAEALEAYLEARKHELLVVRQSVSVSELHANIRNRFVFPLPELDLVLCAPMATRTLSEIYVEQGQARFKGFEITDAISIFEMLDESSPFMRMIAAYHFADWLAQAGRAA